MYKNYQNGKPSQFLVTINEITHNNSGKYIYREWHTTKGDYSMLERVRKGFCSLFLSYHIELMSIYIDKILSTTFDIQKTMEWMSCGTDWYVVSVITTSRQITTLCVALVRNDFAKQLLRCIKGISITPSQGGLTVPTQ